MNVLVVYWWIWVISFLLSVIWIRKNTDYLKIEFENGEFSIFNFEFVEFLLYLISLIFAPLILGSIVFWEIRGFFLIWKTKRILKRKIKKLSDKKVKKELKILINKI